MRWWTVAEKPWGNIIQERIFQSARHEPLGHIKQIHRQNRNLYATPIPKIKTCCKFHGRLGRIAATGGIVSSVEDMSKWMIFNSTTASGEKIHCSPRNWWNTLWTPQCVYRKQMPMTILIHISGPMVWLGPLTTKVKCGLATQADIPACFQLSRWYRWKLVLLFLPTGWRADWWRLLSIIPSMLFWKRKNATTHRNTWPTSNGFRLKIRGYRIALRQKSEGTKFLRAHR